MKTILPILLCLFVFSCSQTQDKFQLQSKTENGFSYEYVTDDPMGTRLYTLDNGLKVYLSQYKDAPRVQVYIPVRAGAKNDPVDNTGLAHYLEHIMFKGTDSFGTLDYEHEKVYLDSIERMFNYYGQLTDTLERKAYYAKIDTYSNEAAQFAIANEYDQITTLLGTKNVNAYTSFDQTVYTVDVPANELSDYFKLEGERFKMIVPRLFHTELESVYEEKNIEDDWEKSYVAVMKSLFPNHPYGTQTIIGEASHLKNPSITAIKAYFEKYYKPNNMAICVSGDIDFDQTIEMISKNFGSLVSNEQLPIWQKKNEDPIIKPLECTVLGPDAEFMYLAYRFDGRSSKDYILLSIVDMILNNAQAGLIDINLTQAQKVLQAGCSPYFLDDYSVHFLHGIPKQDQTLEEVSKLLLGQIELIKTGDFEEWLIPAVVAEFKKNKMKNMEDNESRVEMMKDAFIHQIPWGNYVQELDQMEKITKSDIVAFANEKYNDNYVIVYKREGEDLNKNQIDAPEITKVTLNRDVKSDFHQSISNRVVKKLSPVFINYQSDLSQTKVNNIPVIYSQNKDNELFELTVRYQTGSNDNPTLTIAANYTDFIGTGQLSPEAFKKELYKLGCEMSLNVGEETTKLIISGLDENMEKTMALVDELLHQPTEDQAVLDLMIDRLIKSREDDKKDRNSILWNGLLNYAKFGSSNPFTNVLSNTALKSLQVKEINQLIQRFTLWPHEILYYGSKTENDLTESIKRYHFSKGEFEPLPSKVLFQPQISTNKVYWADFDMAQAEIIFLHKGVPFDPSLMPIIRMFNEYFGGGMNSITFQEIREAQGLAYSVYGEYDIPSKKDQSNYLFAYLGTQADKLPLAMDAMMKITNELPLSNKAFLIAKDAILSKIESERITKSSILTSYIKARDLNLTSDIREEIYNKVKEMTLDDVISFHESYIKNKDYNIVVIGPKDQLNLKALQKYGEVSKVNLDKLFGY